MHEISHFKQRHLWISLLMEIICCIHWWNPVIKYLKRDYMLFLELSNDLHLIQSSPNFNTIHYAELIIKTAKQITIGNLSHFCSPANFVVRNKLILTTRINYILTMGQKKLLKKRCTLWAEFSLLALPLFFLFFLYLKYLIAKYNLLQKLIFQK